MNPLNIVIVNYKTSAFVRKCLESVYQSDTDFDYEVTVVDNNSDDSGIKDLESVFPQTRFIYHDKNAGFAGGNNVGIRAGNAKAVLLLNPDTVIKKNTLKILYKKLFSSNEIGIVGPKTFYEDGTLQTKYLPKKIPNLFYLALEVFFIDKLFKKNKTLGAYIDYTFDYDRVQEVEQVGGACLMIKQEVINKIGLMDENYFMFFEESDWCYQALKAGYKVIYTPETDILHYEGKSSEQVSVRSIHWYYESQLYFLKKNFGSIKMTCMYLINILGYIFRLFLSPLYILKDKNFAKTHRHWHTLLFHLNITNYFRKEYNYAETYK